MHWWWCDSQKLIGASVCNDGSLFWDELDELSVAVWWIVREINKNVRIRSINIFLYITRISAGLQQVFNIFSGNIFSGLLLYSIKHTVYTVSVCCDTCSWFYFIPNPAGLNTKLQSFIRDFMEQYNYWCYTSKQFTAHALCILRPAYCYVLIVVTMLYRGMTWLDYSTSRDVSDVRTLQDPLWLVALRQDKASYLYTQSPWYQCNHNV